MKPFPLRLLPLAALFSLAMEAAAEPGLARYIRQIQVAETGQPSVDTSVTPSGSRDSAWPITSLTSFQLWGLRDAPREWTLADSKSVNAYGDILASISIATRDAVNPARTRADKPYQVTRTIAQLAAEPFAGQETGDLVVTWNYEQLVAGEWQNRDGPFLVNSTHNGAIARTPQLLDRGFEYYYMDALAVYDAPACRLATASAEVFPVASVAAAGITNGMILRGDPRGYPPLRVNCSNLYPDNITLVRLFKPSGQTDLCCLTNQSNLAYSGTLDGHINTAGNYRVAIYEYTPIGGASGGWGWELLQEIGFNAVLAQEINASIITQ
ncbi:MAG: hypothetical protein PHV34_15605 [Verrucomicrobiae bacterium]|nr:hypothetical protein [Verrucomicrobiae bacterium]